MLHINVEYLYEKCMKIKTVFYIWIIKQNFILKTICKKSLKIIIKNIAKKSYLSSFPNFDESML